MVRPCFRSSRPDNWTMPRQNMHPCQRRVVYGPIQPMDEPKGWLTRLFGKR